MSNQEQFITNLNQFLVDNLLLLCHTDAGHCPHCHTKAHRVDILLSYDLDINKSGVKTWKKIILCDGCKNYFVSTNCQEVKDDSQEKLVTEELRKQATILREEQERVEQRGERIHMLSEELSRVREKLTRQTALAAKRLEEIERYKTLDKVPKEVKL